MIVVVGGRASGKRTYVQSLGYAQADMADGVLDERPVLLNLQNYVWERCGFKSPDAEGDANGAGADDGTAEPASAVGADDAVDAAKPTSDVGSDCMDSKPTPDELAASLAKKQVVTCCEIGNGIVPIDPDERAWRELVGRTLNILAERADTVVRMVCGIPVALK